MKSCRNSSRSSSTPHLWLAHTTCSVFVNTHFHRLAKSGSSTQEGRGHACVWRRGGGKGGWEAAVKRKTCCCCCYMYTTLVHLLGRFMAGQAAQRTFQLSPYCTNVYSHCRTANVKLLFLTPNWRISTAPAPLTCCCRLLDFLQEGINCGGCDAGGDQRLPSCCCGLWLRRSLRGSCAGHRNAAALLLQSWAVSHAAGSCQLLCCDCSQGLGPPAALHWGAEWFECWLAGGCC